MPWTICNIKPTSHLNPHRRNVATTQPPLDPLPIAHNNVLPHQINVLLHQINVLPHQINIPLHQINVLPHQINILLHQVNVLLHQINVLLHQINVLSHQINVLISMQAVRDDVLAALSISFALFLGSWPRAAVLKSLRIRTRSFR